MVPLRLRLETAILIEYSFLKLFYKYLFSYFRCLKVNFFVLASILNIWRYNYSAGIINSLTRLVFTGRFPYKQQWFIFSSVSTQIHYYKKGPINATVGLLPAGMCVSDFYRAIIWTCFSW